MNHKILFSMLAAGAVLLPLSAQDVKKTDAAKPTSVDLKSAQGQEAALAAARQAMLSKPATAEEVTEALAFLPDVVAEVGDAKITKKQIVDLLLSKKVSQQVLALTPDSYLRTAMKQYVDQLVDTEILKAKAKAAGFIPSEALVKTQFDSSIKKLPAAQVEALKTQLKSINRTLEQYRDEIAKEAEIQSNASIAAYEEKTFISKNEKAVTDADVEKYYRENQQKFAIPENITVAHILIQSEAPAASDSKEVKETKEKADKLAKEQIDGIYADLVKDPSQFEKIAQEKSSCPSGKRTNGKLPSFDKEGMLLDQSGMLDKSFANAAFALAKPGEFTKPVHTQFGYHIIKLLEKSQKGYHPLDKVKSEVRDFLVTKKNHEEIQAMIKEERAKAGVKIHEFAPAKVEVKPAADKAAAASPIVLK